MFCPPAPGGGKTFKQMIQNQPAQSLTYSVALQNKRQSVVNFNMYQALVLNHSDHRHSPRTGYEPLYMPCACMRPFYCLGFARVG